MTVPDPETYLRCRLEDALLPGFHGGPDEFEHQVRAVTALGLLPASIASAVLADGRWAFGVRNGSDEDDDEQSAAPPRVIVCPTVIEQDWGTLVISHLVLSEHETTIGATGTVTVTPSTARPGPGYPRPGWHEHPWPDELEIDDGRRKATAHFGGGSGDHGFHGTYSLNPGLDPSTSSITVLGHRIDLTGRAPLPTIRIESIDRMSLTERADRYLSLLGDSTRHPRFADGAVVARQVFTDFGLGELPPAQIAVPPRSTMRRRPVRGAESGDARTRRWAAVGASGEVDGMTLVLTTVSTDGRTVDLSYAGRHDANVPGGNYPHEPQVRFTAVDEQGHRAIGQPGERGSTGAEFHGRVTFDLAPGGTVTVEMDTICHHAVVDIPLDWQEAR